VNPAEIHNLAVGIYDPLSRSDLMQNRQPLLTINQKPNPAIARIECRKNVQRLPQQRVVVSVSIPNQNRTNGQFFVDAIEKRTSFLRIPNELALNFGDGQFLPAELAPELLDFEMANEDFFHSFTNLSLSNRARANRTAS
jgi:hypothetical protein